jgi:hypothetical protein
MTTAWRHQGGRYETLDELLARRIARAGKPTGVRAGTSARDPVRLGSQSAQAPGRHASRRGFWRGRQFQGPHLRLYPRRQQPRSRVRQHRLAAARVRPGRQIHPRDRQESLCLVVRPHRAHRQGRQYLGDRQGLEHDHQVRSPRPGRDGVRPQGGGIRPRRQAARPTEPAAASREWSIPPTDRRDLGFGRQYLYQRRLYQCARRQGRQGRQVAHVVRLAGQRAWPAQYPAQHRVRCAEQHLRGRPRQSANSSVRHRGQAPAGDQDRHPAAG